MLSRTHQVYAVRWPGGVEYGLTSDPLFDLRWLSANKNAHSLTTLTPPLPLWLAARGLDEVRRAGASEKAALDILRQVLGRWGRRQSFMPQRATAQESAGVDLPEKELVATLTRVLAGRVLLEEEIYRGLRGRFSIPLGQVDALLRTMVLEGKASLIPGVGPETFDHPRCHRCGERYRVVRVDCPLCGGTCFLCLECAAMGESRGCSSLFLFEPLDSARTAHTAPRVTLPFPLTEAQQNASRELVGMLDCPPHEALVWAVCGAGKTEVAFDAMARAMGRGDKVLYAVPRRDVVHELAPRIRAAFPDEPVLVLPAPQTGSPPERPQRAAVTVATTHQVIRFYHDFDLVVLDEADAYPYAGSPMLYRAVQRARRPGGRMAYLTATPDDGLRKRVKSGDLPAVRIPARHHRHPLAVPVNLRVKLPSAGAGWRLPQSVEHFAQVSLERGARLIVFVPTVELAESVGPVFSAWSALHDVTAEFVHARLGRRSEVISRFKEGSTRLLVSTTVLERGITLPYTDVLVLYAEHDIFDTGTLIQMAGRAGRTDADPVGRVALAHERESPAITEAVRIIIEMNEIAVNQGFLQKEEAKTV